MQIIQTKQTKQDQVVHANNPNKYIQKYTVQKPSGEDYEFLDICHAAGQAIDVINPYKYIQRDSIPKTGDED